MHFPVSYSLKISKRARRYHLEIDWHKGLVVVVPRRWSQEQVQHLLRLKRHWIGKHLRQLDQEKRLVAGKIVNKRLTTKDARLIYELEASYWATIIGVGYNKIILRNQKTKWGSCSHNGTLSFNLNLAYAPEKVREYVVIHELVHRLVPNHSAKFWKLVEKYSAEYNESRLWLRKNGRILANSREVRV